MEAINVMDHNQMALHTLAGCIHTTPPNQMGASGQVDCSQPSGCIVAEIKPNSFQSGFAAAGGGVFAAQFDVEGSVALSFSLHINVLIRVFLLPGFCNFFLPSNNNWF